MRNYKNYKVWQDAMDLSKYVYLLCSTFPLEELYGLKNQLQRAAISIPSNIAEGTSRRTDKAFSNFLEISLGSIYEVETQIELAYHFKYITKEDLDTFNNKIEILRRELISLIKKIK